MKPPPPPQLSSLLVCAKPRPPDGFQAATHATLTPAPRHDAPSRKAQMPSNRSESDEDDEDDTMSHAPVFTLRASTRQRCPFCYEEGCHGCACMCEVSTRWVDHDGGHFFVTCLACGGGDCPGCSCICPKSTILKEHGGHSRRKKHIFSP